jgi:multidrug transporter EmrE-like cation transporter
MQVCLFAIAVIANLVANGLLPQTQGFSVLIPTILCVLSFLVTITMLARLTYSGVSLGIMMPAYAAVVPLGTIAIGVLLYGESASVLRTICLVVACAMVGLANRAH